MQIFRTVACGYRPTWKIIACIMQLSFKTSSRPISLSQHDPMSIAQDTEDRYALQLSCNA